MSDPSENQSKEPLEPPERSRINQTVNVAGEAVLATIPVVGGPLAVLWTQLVGAAYENRRRAWVEEITNAVNDLIERVDDLDSEDLANNDLFLDAVAHATSIAITTSERDKLDALRNAILNSALPGSVGADTQAMFLRHLRDLTASHLLLLALIQDPPAWFEKNDLPWPEGIMSGSLGREIIEVGIPEFKGRREFYDQLDRDLSAAGMTNTGGLHAMMTGNGLKAKRTTKTGDSFLNFIVDPRKS